MSTFVLVHGAWLGAWCWEQVTPHLTAAGHLVRTPELPGHGDDRTPVAKVTLDDYVDAVAAGFPAAPERIVLVGHSMAGIVLSQLAERMPDRLASLVYVSAYLLCDGESIVKASDADPTSLVPPNMVPAPDWSTVAIRPEGVQAVFAADAPGAALERLQGRLRPEPAAPLNTPVRVTAERFGRVRRTYVQTAQDRAVTPALQAAMLAKTPCAAVATLDTSHTPFLAAPTELAAALIRLAGAGAGAGAAAG